MFESCRDRQLFKYLQIALVSQAGASGMIKALPASQFAMVTISKTRSIRRGRPVPINHYLVLEPYRR
jgi:hypothetical protein